MSREEFNIDKIFREVAHKHQEAYDSQDWNALQTQLQAQGLQTKPSVVSQVMKYLTKLVVATTMMYLLPASDPIAKHQVKVDTSSASVAQVSQAEEGESQKSLLRKPKREIVNASGKQYPKPETSKGANLPANNQKEKSLTKAPNKKQPNERQPNEKQPGEKQPSEKQPGKRQPTTLTGTQKRQSNTKGGVRLFVSENTQPTVGKINIPKKKNFASVKNNPSIDPVTNKQVTNLAPTIKPGTKPTGHPSKKTKRTVPKVIGDPKKVRLTTARPTIRTVHLVPAELSNIGWTTTPDSFQSASYLGTHLDDILIQTKRDAIQSFWEGVTWSQRPRNVFEKAGRWLRIVPNPQRIAQKELKRIQTGQKDTLVVAKAPQQAPKVTKQTTKTSKANRFLGVNMPKVRLGKFLSRFFKANPRDTNEVKKQVDTAATKSIYPIREAHLGFVYPLSTNGTEAYEYSNRLSVHALIGGAAALDGTEFSGFGNIEKDYVKGTQFAGFFNTVGNSVTGLQAAGFFNNAGTVRGVQLAGFLNMSGVVKPKQYRFNPQNKAIQAAGFGNLNFTDRLRFQGAGFFNIGHQIEGFQGAGFLNVSRKVTGFQGSGFMGVAEQVTGAQISGFMSVAEKAEGVQMAGFLNIANEVKGYQIGFINIADSVSQGIPIGFLSIVRNGYRRWEVWAGESLHANVGYKIGVREFYNIFAIGGQFLPRHTRWGLGYGIGTVRDLNSKRQLSIEAMAYHINENKFWDERFRLLTQVKVLLGNNARKSWHLGPTLNFLSSQDVPERGIFASELPLYQLVNRTTNGRNTKFWIGFQAGIRF